MRKLICLLLLVCLCGAGPKADRNSSAFNDVNDFIASLGPTCDLDPDFLLTIASGAVSSWCCKNAPSICFTQGTAGARPTLSTLKGKRTLDFDGSDDTLTTTTALSSFVAATAKTVIILARHDNTIQNKEIFGDSGAKFYISGDGSTVAGAFKVVNDSNSVQQSGNCDDGICDIGGLSTIVVTHDGPLLTIKGSGDNLTNASTTSALTGTMRMGGTGAAFFDGQVSRIITFNKVLATQTLKYLAEELSRKYNVALTYGPNNDMECYRYISSLIPTVWLDAGDLSTITKDVNNKVSAWNSRIGSITFTQATAGNQPTWGGQGITFDGAASPNHDYLASTATSNDVIAAGAKSFCMVLSSTSTASTQYIFGDDATYWFFQVNSNSYSLTNYDGSAGRLDVGASSGATYLFCGKHSGGNLNGWLNATAVGPVASGDTSTLTNIIYIGSRTGGAASPWAGIAKEVLVDNTAWTDIEFGKVRSCLKRKYGITF